MGQQPMKRPQTDLMGWLSIIFYFDLLNVFAYEEKGIRADLAFMWLRSHLLPVKRLWNSFSSGCPSIFKLSNEHFLVKDKKNIFYTTDSWAEVLIFFLSMNSNKSHCILLQIK